MNAKKYLFVSCTFFSLFSGSLVYAGFIAGTLIKTKNNLIPIEQLKIGDRVVCQANNNQFVLRPITNISRKKITSHFIRLTIKNNYILTTINQSFYLFNEKKWCTAQKLKIGQKLSTYNNNVVILENTEIIQVSDYMYDLSIEEFHNFCITQDNIIVHNFVITVPVVAFGFGKAAFFSGVTIKTVLAALGAGIICKFLQKKTGISIDAEIGIDGSLNGKSISGVYTKEEIEITCNKKTKKKNKKHGKEKGPTETDAQAPGKPTEKDGYFPPKNWDGKKRKHPKNGKVGWPDRKGNLWVPSGPGPLAHGGPHWDVQYPDGSHDNMMPGGKIRGKK